ncbi:MAG: cytochrome P450 [Acidimicrobiia bacterium]
MTTTTAAHVIGPDWADPPVPWTPEGVADPNPWFAKVLHGPPLVYDEHSDVWHLFRHADVHAYLLDDQRLSLAKRVERQPQAKRLLATDPPEHGELRSHFSRAYRPKRISGFEERIRSLSRSLVARALEAGTVDVAADIAEPLTRQVMGDLIGIPVADLDELSRRAIRNANGSMERAPDGSPVMVLWMGDDDRAKNREFNEYFADLIALRRREPADDLVSDLAAVPPDSFSGAFDIGALLDEQLGSGQNTTTHGLSTILALLDRHRDQLRRLRDDPALVPSTVEEALRICSPSQGRFRITTSEVELHGERVPAGAQLVAWLQAANLDPAVFDEPLRFDVGRTRNNHLTFGFGEHYCLGASLARMELRIFLEEWLRAVADYERTDDGPLEWLPMYMLRGLARFDVSLRAA